MSVCHLPQDLNRNSPQMKLMLNWIQAAEEKNVGILEKCLHKDFQRMIYPQNIGEPAESKQHYINLCATLYLAADLEVNATSCH
jgi:hypothetical protein